MEKIPNPKIKRDMPNTINPNIFREYDIRGVVEQDLTSATVELIGKAVGTHIKRNGGKTLTVGRDMRQSSVEFRDVVG